MSSVGTRRALAALVCAAGLVLTGCGTGFDAQTTQKYDAAVGSNARGGDVEVHNGLFVDNDGKTATMSASFLNKSEQEVTLTGIEVADESGKPISSTFAEPVVLKPQILYISGKTPDAMLTGTFRAGQFVTITFAFDGAGSVSLDVPVVKRNDDYTEIAEKPASKAPTTTEKAKDAETGQ